MTPMASAEIQISRMGGFPSQQDAEREKFQRARAWLAKHNG